MLEVKRILCNSRTLILAFLLLFLHSVFFYYQCNTLKQNTLTGQQLEEYISGYPQYVETVIENAEEMLDNPLFNTENSFVYRNIVKTKTDYQKLLSVRPAAGENQGIITLVNFSLSGYLLLLIGIYFVTQFLTERQKGLFLLVRSTYNGRFSLTCQRILTLFLGVTLSGLMLFFSALIISLFAFPGTNLSRPIQSIPQFNSFTNALSIRHYLLLYLLYKITGVLLTCLLFYLCMSLFRSSLCAVLFGLTFTGEYLLYRILVPTSKFCILKYVNLYTLIFRPQDYGHYYNLNFFQCPVATSRIALTFALLFMLAFCIICIRRFTGQYPGQEQKGSPTLEKLSLFISKKKPCLTPFLWECRKILIDQKGLLIFAITLFLAWSSAKELHYYDYRTHYVTDWYEEYNGVVNDALVDEILSKKEFLTNKIARWEKALVRYYETLERYREKGFDLWQVEANIASMTQTIAEHKKILAGLEVVLEQASLELDCTKKTGITTYLMEPSCYELLFQKDYKTVQQNTLFILLTIILMFSGTMSCEKSSHMDTLLHTLYHGRRPLLFRKLFWVITISILCGLCFHMVQFIEIGHAMPYHDLQASIQSVPCMVHFPLPFTIFTYLIILYLGRVLLAFLMGAAVMFISNYSKNRMTTIALSIFFLLIPLVTISLFSVH